MDTNVATDKLDCYGLPNRICDTCGYGALRGGGAGLYTLLILRSLRQLRAATLV